MYKIKTGGNILMINLGIRVFIPKLAFRDRCILKLP